MQQHLNGRDVPGALNVRPRRIGWGVIPLLTVAGGVSALETLVDIIRSELNGGGNLTSTVLLGGLCLGLTVITALWFYRCIPSWMSAVLLLAVMVAANCPPLFYKVVPQFFYQDKDLPLLGTTELLHFVFFFPACLVTFIGFALVLLSIRNALRTVPIAILSAVIATLTFVFIAEQQRGYWFSFWTGKPLFLLWQMMLTFFLGISLWVGQITIRDGSSTLEPLRIRRAGSSLRHAWIALGVLVCYFIGLHIWTGAVVKRYAKMVDQIQARTKVALAQSLADAPSRENLPPVQQDPIENVLLTQTVAGWTPFASGSKLLPAEDILPAIESTNARALRPERYSSGVSYTDGGLAFGLRVNVTSYPTADWARYELRHVSAPNELILHPDWVKKLTKFGNSLYQDGPYFYWSSGKNLVLVDGQGIQQSVIDEFLRAYLAKYPSSM